MIVMGSSLSVMPAGQIPNLAIKSGAKIVILNREETIYDAMANIVINDELKIICKELIKLIQSCINAALPIIFPFFKSSKV